jgi:hypothetical protein
VSGACNPGGLTRLLSCQAPCTGLGSSRVYRLHGGFIEALAFCEHALVVAACSHQRLDFGVGPCDADELACVGQLACNCHSCWLRHRSSLLQCELDRQKRSSVPGRCASFLPTAPVFLPTTAVFLPVVLPFLPIVPPFLPTVPSFLPIVPPFLPTVPSFLPIVPPFLPTVPSFLPIVPPFLPTVLPFLPTVPSFLPIVPVSLPIVPVSLPIVPVSLPIVVPRGLTSPFLAVSTTCHNVCTEPTRRRL